MTKRTGAELDAIAKRIETTDPSEFASVPLGDLRVIAVLSNSISDAETRLVEAVAGARRQGRSWAQIGAVLGVSKQAAQRKYHAKV